MKYKFSKNMGFSLAEAMVSMVIIAIVLAAIAPLIANNMSNKQKGIIYRNGLNINTAKGNNQDLQIGLKKFSDKLKLRVFGNTAMDGDLTIQNKDNENTKTIKLTAEGIKTEDNKVIFNVDSDTEETNIELFIPNYEKMSAGSVNTYMKAPSNGYVFIENSVKGFEINTNSNCMGSAPSGSNSNGTILYTAKQEIVTIGEKKQIVATVMPLLVPIQKNNCYKCKNENITINGTTVTTSVDSTSNYCYFIPLAKAGATIIDPS